MPIFYRFGDITSKTPEIAVFTHLGLISGLHSDRSSGNCRIEFGSEKLDSLDGENYMLCAFTVSTSLQHSAKSPKPLILRIRCRCKRWPLQLYTI